LAQLDAAKKTKTKSTTAAAKMESNKANVQQHISCQNVRVMLLVPHMMAYYIMYCKILNHVIKEAKKQH
jgi:hypothetical protein